MLPGMFSVMLSAVAGNAHASALQLLTQLRFLPVHVVADGAARERTNASADQRAFAAIPRIIARENAGHRANGRADAGAGRWSC